MTAVRFSPSASNSCYLYYNTTGRAVSSGLRPNVRIRHSIACNEKLSLLTHQTSQEQGRIAKISGTVYGRQVHKLHGEVYFRQNPQSGLFADGFDCLVPRPRQLSYMSKLPIYEVGFVSHRAPRIHSREVPHSLPSNKTRWYTRSANSNCRYLDRTA